MQKYIQKVISLKKIVLGKYLYVLIDKNSNEKDKNNKNNLIYEDSYIKIYKYMT